MTLRHETFQAGRLVRAVIDNEDGTGVDEWYDAEGVLTASTPIAGLPVVPLAARNADTIRTAAAQVLDANRTDKTTNDAYLAIASPTNAQNLAQIRELSRQSSRQARQLNQLIRQTYRLFDGTD